MVVSEVRGNELEWFFQLYGTSMGNHTDHVSVAACIPIVPRSRVTGRSATPKRDLNDMTQARRTALVTKPR